MDIRLLIVASPFIIAFLYTLFWLKKWGAFNSSFNSQKEKITSNNKTFEENYKLENIFFLRD